jgi:hypothetical protein
MRSLTAAEMVTAWEHGIGRRPSVRALTVLEVACPEMSPDALAALSLGRRDALLLASRALTFGTALTGLAVCPACGNRLEMTFSVADVMVRDPSEANDGEFHLVCEDYEVRFRLPYTTDVVEAGITGRHDLDAARRALLRACITHATHAGQDLSADELPASVLSAVVDGMAAADPQANVDLALTCPACAHPWSAPFDIATFFWHEIAARAIRTLQDVHTLASAYGWAECDILAMNPHRRQAYLGLVGA